MPNLTKRKLYDLVYHIRHKSARNSAARAYIRNTPDYRIYQLLYNMWHYDSRDCIFNAPTREARKALLAKKASGCSFCSSKSSLALSHIDADTNNNVISNIRWLCKSCRSEEKRQRKFKSLDASGKFEEIVGKRYASYEDLSSI